MAIVKKPSNNKNNTDLTDEIISKGGSSPSTVLNGENHHIKVTLRLPYKMLNIIDSHLSDSISKKTRTCWIREAIEEKIKKDII